jgi:cell division control protein 6
MGVEELFFPPYDKETLKEILRQRGAEAYKPGAVSDEVIEECVRYAAEQHRDVRRMVDMFRVCGEVAEKDGAARVEMKHFKEALDRFEMDHYNTLLSGLAEAQRDMLCTLALLSEVKGVKVASTSQTHQYYQEALNGPALSHRRVLGLLKELEVLNLVGTRNISKGRGGRSNEVWLRIPARPILDNRPDLKERAEQLAKLEKVEQSLKKLKERLSDGRLTRRRRNW